MGTPYLAEIRMMSFQFAPKGWALCNGQILSIQQNQALFALLGTTYGGNGIQNFALPNLQGRVPLHMGNGHTLGEFAGLEQVTISTPTLPNHTHALMASSAAATSGDPTNLALATSTAALCYTPMGGASTTLAPATIAGTGQSQPHSNLQPYHVTSFCIALSGIFPSQN